MEGIAARVRRLARIGDEVVLAPTIAEAAIGRGTVRRVDRVMGTDACLVKIYGQPRIYVSARARDKNFAVAHETAHWALEQEAYEGPDEEALANRIAAAILAPPSLVRRARERHGEDVRQLALGFYVTQSCMTLRLAEVLGDDRMVVTKNRNVMRRTQASFPWADDDARTWVTGRPPRGVLKVRLTGAFDAGRVAFRAA